MFLSQSVCCVVSTDSITDSLICNGLILVSQIKFMLFGSSQLHSILFLLILNCFSVFYLQLCNFKYLSQKKSVNCSHWTIKEGEERRYVQVTLRLKALICVCLCVCVCLYCVCVLFQLLYDDLPPLLLLLNTHRCTPH